MSKSKIYVCVCSEILKFRLDNGDPKFVSEMYMFCDRVFLLIIVFHTRRFKKVFFF